MSGNKVHISQTDSKILVNATDTDILASSSTFTGDIINVSGYTHVTGFAFSDVDSATDGLVIEQAAASADFTAGAITQSTYTISGGDIELNAFSVQIVAPFVRITYTNGGTGQTSFRLFGQARTLRGL